MTLDGLEPVAKSHGALSEGGTTSGPPVTNDEHDTLKYHLLGPSLTKAGQESVDQHKVRRTADDTGVERVIDWPFRFQKSSTTPLKAPNSSTMKRTRTRLLRKRSTAF